MVAKGSTSNEIGIIPQNWEIARIGNSFKFKNGLNKEKHFFGYGYPIVNYMDVFRNTSLTSAKINGKVYVSNAELKNFNVSKGDVLFTRTSETHEEIGLTAVVTGDLLDTVFSGFLLRAKPFNTLFDVEFCRYCFDSMVVRRQIISHASYTTRALTNGRVLSEVQIPLPPLPEQKAIAEALSDADAWIANLEQLIAKKRLIKQGAMQQLLSPKEDWEVKKLGEVAEIVIGLTYSPNDVKEFGTLVLRSSNVQNNKLAFANNVYVSMILPSRVIVRENDLLVCVRNGSKDLIGKCALIDAKTEGQAFGAFMAVVRSENNRYIFQYFQTNHIQSQIDENLGATINQLTNKNLKEFEINFPKSLSEQIRIAAILSDMDNEIESLENQLAKARQIKQGMMQELLTGRVRLV